MAEYKLVNTEQLESDLTNIADKIRILNGTTDKMSLGEMATNVGAANDEVDSQTELLAQAITALEGKVAAGGSGGGSIEINISNPEACYVCAVIEGNTNFTQLYTGTNKLVGGAIFFDTSSYEWDVSGSTYDSIRGRGIVIFNSGATFTVANPSDIG